MTRLSGLGTEHLLGYGRVFTDGTVWIRMQEELDERCNIVECSRVFSSSRKQYVSVFLLNRAPASYYLICSCVFPNAVTVVLCIQVIFRRSEKDWVRAMH